MIAALLAGSAAAQGVAFALSAGPDVVVNATFVRQVGLRMGFTAAVTPWAEIGVVGVLFPSLGYPGAYTPLAHDIHDRGEFISFPERDAQVYVVARARLYRARLAEGWSGGIGLFLGGGALLVREDAALLGHVFAEPNIVRTDPWLYAGASGGVYWEVRSDHFGVRMRYEQDVRVTDLAPGPALQNDELLGLEGMWWF